MSIREFTMDDYDAAFALWQNAGPGLGIGRSDTCGEIMRKLRYAPDLFLVAEESGPERSRRIIGTVIGGYDGRRGIVYHLAVEQSYRGNGIGKMLMTEIEKRLAAKGCVKAYLLVVPDNTDVIEFYRRIGWDMMPVTPMGKTLIEIPKETC
ncbi:MAG: GNAT family acetyltransferase [Chloroflexi bacterium]|nr:GNAT family acetyltransferase [Chloroflexota bacterium]